jgi:hypothetical protein
LFRFADSKLENKHTNGKDRARITILSASKSSAEMKATLADINKSMRKAGGFRYMVTLYGLRTSGGATWEKMVNQELSLPKDNHTFKRPTPEEPKKKVDIKCEGKARISKNYDKFDIADNTN